MSYCGSKGIQEELKNFQENLLYLNHWIDFGFFPYHNKDPVFIREDREFGETITTKDQHNHNIPRISEFAISPVWLYWKSCVPSQVGIQRGSNFYTDSYSENEATFAYISAIQRGDTSE